MAAQTQPHVFTFAMIMLNTLARPEAAIELSPAQVSLSERLVNLNPEGRKQTKKVRPTVPLTDTLKPFLQATDIPRFVMWNGQPIKSLKRAFARAVREARLPTEITPYSLRHTMAVELRKRGVPAWEVEGLLGHRRPGVTETYAEFDPEYLSAGRTAIDAYFAELKLVYDIPQQLCVSPACHSLETKKSPSGDFSITSKVRMVGGTGIEPVTPTMST